MQIYDEAGAVVGKGIAESDGTYVVQLSTALADGTHRLFVRCRDAARNLGEASETITLTIVTTP